jgi:hypothetical protein
MSVTSEEPFLKETLSLSLLQSESLLPASRCVGKVPKMGTVILLPSMLLKLQCRRNAVRQGRDAVELKHKELVHCKWKSQGRAS